MRPLAIIERDGSFALELLRALQSAGFRAAILPSARAALPLLRDRHFALALLDLGVEDVDAFDVFRETSPIVPTIALAHAPAGQEACMRALEAGADDCLCRDFGDRELIARIRNLLRRAEQPADFMTAVVSEMRVRLGDRVENLTAGETAVLSTLLERAPRPMTILEIAHAIGANRGTVEARIKSLRRKLGRERLVSRGRLGYQLE